MLRPRGLKEECASSGAGSAAPPPTSAAEAPRRRRSTAGAGCVVGHPTGGGPASEARALEARKCRAVDEREQHGHAGGRVHDTGLHRDRLGARHGANESELREVLNLCGSSKQHKQPCERDNPVPAQARPGLLSRWVSGSRRLSVSLVSRLEALGACTHLSRKRTTSCASSASRQESQMREQQQLY